MESINDGGSGFKFGIRFRVESFCFSRIPVIIFRQDRKKTDDRRAFGVIFEDFALSGNFCLCDFKIRTA